MAAYRELQLHGVQRSFYFNLPICNAAFSIVFIYGIFISLQRFKSGDYSHNNEVILAMSVVLLLISWVLTAILYHILKTQLRYTVVSTSRTAQKNFEKVMITLRSEQWIIQEASVPNYIICITSKSIRKIRIKVTILFEGSDVFINSIVDPMGYTTGAIRSQARYIQIVSNSVA